MAQLFINQAKQYHLSRPNYPEQLFRFIASKTPCHDLVWDVGTGTGQAAIPLAKIFKKVVATDTSPNQLEFAAKIPNVRYECTPSKISMTELEQKIAAKSSIDLVTIAQALHWFDFESFYQQVKYVLKKPNGVVAAWCYAVPHVNNSVDSVFQKFYTVDSKPFWESQRRFVDEEFRTIDFPFEVLDGLEDTGPIQFKAESIMDLQGFFTYIRSWSAYQTAKEKGIELLKDDLVKDFARAWEEDGKSEKIVTYPVYLRIGKVGNLD
ncbi:hypothetical protein M9H77_02428 [Catharanthus roseus]|uniref:Uncharacterized protein n=1 Tax=Catharanthus roseus TaxID=4058 RepID=A0ACC0C8E9_CATRO|nr:hypothetical protein M9H77_02428 [Catharanthus roseus]